MRRNTVLVRLGLILCCATTLGADWPHVRGPALDGRASAGGSLDSVSALEVAWNVPLGSGYSGVAVAGGRAVTLYSDGESDWVAAFDAASGKQAWGFNLGATYQGHDGSDDGPLASPSVGDGLVFAIGPRGSLVALRLGDGTEAWTKQLVDDFGAKAPEYGFSTAPLVEGRLVIVQAGGSGDRMLVALEARTGATVWTQGGDGVEYQSPAVMSLAGRRQLVAVGEKSLSGFDPATGKALWTREFPDGTGGSSTTPTFIGEDRFLLLLGGDARVFRVAKAGSGFEVTQLYESDALGGSYAHPVYHEGHLYGFRGQILTCVDAATGERVWRSREPGGDGLILVDGKLVIFGAKGNVVVADATPGGYQERARLRALAGSSLTWPSFADGRIFVRNLDALAAVAARRGGAPAAVVERAEPEHEFGRWLRQLAAAGDKPAMVDALLARQVGTPLVEGKYVHFVYRGDVKDVAVAGSMNDTENAEPMLRADGSDLFYRTYQLEPGVRWEYAFQTDYESWTPDPHNPRSVPAVEGDRTLSEVATGGQAPPKFLEAPTGGRGRIDTFMLESRALGAEREIKVWVPPGYDGTELSYPLLVVNDGAAWLDKGLLATALDNLVGSRVAPLVVAFVPAGRQWWFETGGSRTDDYARMLAAELVPQLEQRYRLIAKAEARALLGTRFYAFSAVYTAVAHPEVFGKAALQSIFLGIGHVDELEAKIARRPDPAPRFYLDWNRFDERNIDRGWDFAQDSRRVADLLRQAGYALDGGEVLDSHGWGGWRGRIDRVLVLLFPAG